METRAQQSSFLLLGFGFANVIAATLGDVERIWKDATELVHFGLELFAAFARIRRRSSGGDNASAIANDSAPGDSLRIDGMNGR